MVALPLMLIAALQLGASEDAGENNRINLVDVATASGLNFTLFVLFATTGFFLVVVYALFFGDTVASEAQWGVAAVHAGHAGAAHAAAPAEVAGRAGAVGRRAAHR